MTESVGHFSRHIIPAMRRYFRTRTPPAAALESPTALQNYLLRLYQNWQYSENSGTRRMRRLEAIPKADWIREGF